MFAKLGLKYYSHIFLEEDGKKNKFIILPHTHIYIISYYKKWEPGENTIVLSQSPNPSAGYYFNDIFLDAQFRTYFAYPPCRIVRIAVVLNALRKRASNWNNYTGFSERVIIIIHRLFIISINIYDTHVT